MEKIKKYIFSLFLILLSFYINSSIVHADSNGFIGTGEPGGGCSSRYCYTNEVGVRITIVNKDGNRCYYDAPQNKIFCGPDVTFYDNRPHEYAEQDNVNNRFSLSIDYWFSDNGILLYPNDCWQYGYKYTKREFVQSSIKRQFGFVGKCSIYENWGDATDYSLKWLFFGDQAKSHKDIKTDTGSWKVLTRSGVYKSKEAATAAGDDLQLETNRNPANINNIIDYLECINYHTGSKKFGAYDADGNQVDLLPSECSTIRSPAQKQNNIDIYNRLFRNAFKNKSFDVRKVELVNARSSDPELSKIYIQFEEVVAFSQYDSSLSPSTFKGTVSEVAYLYSHFKDKTGDNKPGTVRWSLIGTAANLGKVYDSSTMDETSDTIRDIGSNDTSAICTNIFDGWTNNTINGVLDLGVIVQGKDLLISRNSSSKVYCDGRHLKIKSGYDFTNWLYARYGSTDTRNIASFWVNPSAFGDCNSDARNIISNPSYAGSSNWKETLKSSANIKSKCFDSDGNFNYADCYQLDSTYVDKVGIATQKRMDGSKIDVCAPLNCEDTLKYSSKVNENQWRLQHVSSKEYVEDLTNPNSLPTLYDKGIYYLFHTTDKGFDFSGFTNLNYYNYRGMYNKPAECKVTPNAPITVESSCDESGTITFEDSAYCSSGIAYTNSGGGNGQSSFDSNFDITQEVEEPVYDSSTGEVVTNEDGTIVTHWVEETKSGYCEEKVKFTLPQHAGTVKAGTVIKWGLDTSLDNSKFGTMYLERTCHYPTKDSGARNAKIVTNNIDLGKINGLNPDLNIKYSEALGDGEDRVNTYDFDLVKLKFNQTSLSVNSSNLSPGTSSYTCSGCAPGSTVTMVTDYDISYPDKLKWYFDKASKNNTKLVNKEDATGDVENDLNYVFVGFGLPTSFRTPTNVYDKTEADYDNSNSYGYLEDLYDGSALILKINNVGSKSGGTYHFDKQIGYQDTSDKYDYPYMLYSCGFSVKNDLYDTESGKNKCRLSVDGCKSPRGLDVVFRTVQLVDDEDDLDNAFPGRSGSGRASERGGNWKKISDVKVANILSSKVYDYIPLYHIELTPGKITDIRRDNKELRKKGFDPYTYMGESYRGSNPSDKYNTYDFMTYDSSAAIDEDLSLIDLKDEYLYTTSYYLTKAMSDYGLNGSCMVSNRLEKHANTQGCHPWILLRNLVTE